MACRELLRLANSVLAAACLSAPPSAASAQGTGLALDWHGVGTNCSGNCGVHVFAGAQTITSPGMAFGLADITQGRYGLVFPTPIWAYEWENSGLAGFALSREFASLSFNDTDLLGVEGEIGAGQRFGDQQETEVWAALYFRWKWFPWNDVVKTSLAMSTGLNYATGISDYELQVSGNGEGSNLLHFFSPEITFAHPDRPEREFVFRMHHRSGIQDDAGSPGFAIFNYADTGATFATFGLRHRF